MRNHSRLFGPSALCVLGLLACTGQIGDAPSRQDSPLTAVDDDAFDGAGAAEPVDCDPGQEQLCTCYGVPSGNRVCGDDGTFPSCPSCPDPQSASAASSSSSGGGQTCVDHCNNNIEDCGETGVDCGGDCNACPPPFYFESDCIKAARNGSEICDDAAWTVDSPGNDLVLVCITDEGGDIYVSTNTGPPDPNDGIKRCQGWEINNQNAWDHLNYLYRHTCTAAQQVVDLDLSSYVGQRLYFGAHEDGNGGGRFTHMCLARKK